MIPEPLHPAIVHFPIVFASFLPFVALWAWWQARRNRNRSRIWGIAVVLTGLLFISTLVARATGEKEKEVAERAVAEQPIETHEESAQQFVILSGIVTLIAAAGLAGGAMGRVARGGAVVGAVLILAAGWQTGRSGGDLAYRHGAASAWQAHLSPGTAPDPGRIESGAGAHQEDSE